MIQVYGAQKTALLHVLSKGGSVSVVPKDCKEQISEQVYDYPYILRHEARYLEEKPQDIVYISYDEVLATERYNNLKARFPRIKWCKILRVKHKHTIRRPR